MLGRVVTVNARPYTIVGVMPKDFEFPSKRYQLWVPFAFRNNAQGMVNRNARYLQVVGRLRSGTAPAQGEAELATIAARLEKAYPDQNAGTGLRSASLVEETIGDVRTAMFLLWSVVGFVLLIACANVTNLLLARASAREREVAVRTALGAGRARLVRQLLTETLVLYGVGALAGILLAAWGLDLLVRLSPADIPRLDQTQLDRTTLLFTLAISLVTGVVFGILPALQTTKRSSSTALRSSSRSVTSGRASQHVRAILVAAEVALSLMLLVGAGLATRSLQRVLEVDPRVRAEGVLTFNLVPPEARYSNAASVIRFHNDVYADVKHSGPESVTRPEVMLPYTQSGSDLIAQWFRGLSVVVRTAGDPMSILAVARDTVRSVDPTLPLVAPQRMSALVAGSVARPRFRSTLLLTFAAIAAVLALVGIYGVVAFIVNQRAHEIGVRLALGAQRRDVLALVMRQGATPIVAGIIIGLAGAIGIGRAMRSLLFEVTATDLTTFIAVPLLLALVALVAILIPARRAMKVQPATALRAD